MTWNDVPQPTITTERLILRPFQLSDASRVQELAGDRAIADTTATVPHPYPQGAAEAWISTHANQWSAGTAVTFAVTRAEDGELVGAVGLEINQPDRSGELGYWIGKPYWGHGFATEAAGALLDFAFATASLNRVQARHLTRNPASGRVMEKLGMAHEGLFREATKKWDAFEDVAQRAVLRRDWETRRRP
jgi:[ribosomal protein S5]-alanine N-acetyltransferase